MNDPTAQESDRNNAVLAARTNRCPACDTAGTIVIVEGDNPDGTTRLLEVSCMACEWEWPR